MEFNHNYYHIDIADIWQYERLIFLSDKSSKELAKTIIDKVEAKIIKDGNPVYGKDYFNNADEKIRTYYERNKREHAEASNSLKERFRIDFFFNKHSCFQFDQTIEIKRNNIDFDFWFALKIRQYDSKISEIKNFLNFQLEANFNNDIDEFVGFLNLIFRQYKVKLIKKLVVHTVNDWMVNKPKVKKIIEQEDFVEDNGHDNKLILKIKAKGFNLFDVLEEYFGEKDHEKLRQLLNEEEIQDKICFRSNANQLVLVFRQLHLNQKIIGQLSNTEKWICKYFTYLKQEKKVSNFDLGYVHKFLTSNSRTVLKSKRIDIPELEYIIVKSK